MRDAERPPPRTDPDQVLNPWRRLPSQDLVRSAISACLCSTKCFAERVPIPLALCCGPLIGLAFARVAQGLLLRTTGAPYNSPAFTIAAVFGWLVLGPLVAVCAALSPDWTLCYLFDSQHTPVMLETVSLLAVASSVPLGFLWGAQLIARRRHNSLSRYLAVGAVLGLVICIGLWKRIGTQATYAQFHGDFGLRPLAGTEFGYLILWMLLLLGLASTWTVFSLFKLCQQAAPD